MEVCMTKTVSMRHFMFSDSSGPTQTAYQTGSREIRLYYPVWLYNQTIRSFVSIYWFRPLAYIDETLVLNNSVVNRVRRKCISDMKRPKFRTAKCPPQYFIFLSVIQSRLCLCV